MNIVYIVEVSNGYSSEVTDCDVTVHFFDSVPEAEAWREANQYSMEYWPDITEVERRLSFKTVEKT